MTSSIVIQRRFCGPPDSGNGGYSCGVLARGAEGPIEVTLRKPPPLERALAVSRADGGKTLLFHGTTLIAEAVEAALDLEVPAPVSLQAAEVASVDFPWKTSHAFPMCFTCGPANEGGLKIFSGPVPGRNVFAGPWVPSSTLPTDGGLIAPEIVWAALDCPGGVGAWMTKPIVEAIGLLGRMTADIARRPAPGEACVALGWRLGVEGRKVFAGSALYSADGELLGRSRQTWILLEEAR
jgi:hypothetical protein